MPNVSGKTLRAREKQEENGNTAVQPTKFKFSPPAPKRLHFNLQFEGCKYLLEMVL